MQVGFHVSWYLKPSDLIKTETVQQILVAIYSDKFHNNPFRGMSCFTYADRETNGCSYDNRPFTIIRACLKWESFMLSYVMSTTDLSMRGVIWLGTATQIQRRHQAAASLAAWQGWTSTAIIASIRPTHTITHTFIHHQKWKNRSKTALMYD